QLSRLGFFQNEKKFKVPSFLADVPMFDRKQVQLVDCICITKSKTPHLILFMPILEETFLEIKIPLSATRLHSGGLRWWFHCPLAQNNKVPCHRRVAKLYLPSGQRAIGCRNCMDLTYRSCQESGQFRKFWQMMATETGMPASAIRKGLEERYR
ncbi:MAG: hypothetical protein AB7P49_17630, partial [Bdellovibrionales bacterium]